MANAGSVNGSADRASFRIWENRWFNRRFLFFGINFTFHLAKPKKRRYNESMKLIMYCDYGLDDALATWDALTHACADGYDCVDLVAVGGNVPPEVSLCNAKKLLEQLEGSLPKITFVDTAAEPQPSEFLKEIHGGDGMGDLFSDCAKEFPSVPFSRWLNSLAGEYDLLSLGPMTLVPALLARGGCRKFVFMGGNIAEEPNFHGYEFNHALNRAAFTEATRSHAHVAVTMDTCRHPAFNIQEEKIVGEALPFRIARRLRDLGLASGERGCYVWDDIAVLYLREPERFKLVRRTDRDGNILTVAEYLGGERFLELLTKSL